MKRTWVIIFLEDQSTNFDRLNHMIRIFCKFKFTILIFSKRKEAKLMQDYLKSLAQFLEDFLANSSYTGTKLWVISALCFFFQFWMISASGSYEGLRIILHLWPHTIEFVEAFKKIFPWIIEPNDEIKEPKKRSYLVSEPKNGLYGIASYRFHNGN